MNIRRQLLIALLIMIAGGLAAFAIFQSPPQTDKQAEAIKLPSVKAIKVKLDNVSPAFVNGGFFHKGDLLVSIDPAPYD